jgi:hypothetical protein
MPASGDFSWLQLFAAALGGGVTVKAIDIIYQEVRRRQDTTQTARKFVDEHLDPLLKAADEVVGKLHSLALNDFKTLAGREISLNPVTDNDFGSLLYLVSRFWARIEILKQEGLSVAISKDERGARLQSFFACLESRRVRIVDRISQRAIGELLIKPAPDYLRNVLGRTANTADRQQLLLYGVVVHAMIDTLDPTHSVTSARPSYPVKLNDRARKDLKYRVFGVYLRFVSDTAKYLVWEPKAKPKKAKAVTR